MLTVGQDFPPPFVFLAEFLFLAVQLSTSAGVRVSAGATPAQAGLSRQP